MAGSGSYARPAMGKSPLYVLGGILTLGTAMGLAAMHFLETPEQKAAMKVLNERDAAEFKLENDATPAQQQHMHLLEATLGDANKYADIALSNTDKPSDLRDDIIVVSDISRMVAAGARYKVDGIVLRVVNDDLSKVGKIPTLTQEEKATLGDAKQKVADARLAIK